VGAILLPPDAEAPAVPVIRVANPHLAFVDVVALFHPPAPVEPGVHPTAIVAPTARLGAGDAIGPHAVVGDGVVLGDHGVLHAGVVLYPRVRIGARFTAHARVVVREDVQIGAGCPSPGRCRRRRVRLRALAEGAEDPQGTVVVDDVEIGANTTVDRAALGATRIGRAKIDNLVMIAHGCVVGPYSLLAGQVGLAGGTTLGTGVMLAGQVGSAGHLTIGDGAKVAAKTGVANDLAAGGTYGGIPAIEVGQWRRAMAGIRRIGEILRRVRRLERHAGIEPDGE
jgi:UDP-3-O-[3-hydroxymyristoyl] glucosamine N-acyltransferase